MEKIFEVLEEMQVQEEQLPSQIQDAINDLDKKTIEFQKSFDELEAEGKTQEEIQETLGSWSEQLDEYEDNIIENIENWYESLDNEPQINEPQYNNGGYVQNTKEKEKKKGGGMIIFGIFALVLTLGAVNVMKNR